MTGNGGRGWIVGPISSGVHINRFQNFNFTLQRNILVWDNSVIPERLGIPEH